MKRVFKACEVKLKYQPKTNFFITLDSPSSIYDYALQIFDKDTLNLRESIKCIFLNRNLQFIGWFHIGDGGLNAVMCDIRLVLISALLMRAERIILIHNHPSGRLVPSQDDDKLTIQLKTGLSAIGLELTDHIIISNQSYYSYSENHHNPF